MRRLHREQQLHLKVQALCGEAEKVLDVLVAKGAKVRLFNADLSPPDCPTKRWRPSRRKAANGQYMVAGTKEAKIAV